MATRADNERPTGPVVRELMREAGTRMQLFNPQPRIDIQRMSNGQPCLVVDDALVDPDRMVQFAATHRGQFHKTEFNSYPGLVLPMPDNVTAALGEFFAVHIRRAFDARRTAHMHCRLSMVTLARSALEPWQCFCHRDVPELDPQHSIQGSVLYLFRDESLGGTSFYEPIRPEDETVRLGNDALHLSRELFWKKYEIKQTYQCDSNAWFTRVGGVPARWNRMIFYDAYCWHSGDILAPDRLTDDPLSGRLTLNGFFTSRRNLA